MHDTQGLIDNININLWKSLICIHEISILRENRNDYLAHSQNGKTIIYVPISNPNPASFCHELLHIFLRTKNVFIGVGLKLSIKENHILSAVFSDKLLDHIGNCLDHIKIYPEFIKLGYSSSDFISDYYENKFTTEELNDIKTHFVKQTFLGKSYNKSAINLFIGKYFAVKACPNKSIDYSCCINELNKIDANLFNILQNFYTAWHNFDYNNEDPIKGDYYQFLFEFIHDLEKWVNKKKIK